MAKYFAGKKLESKSNVVDASEALQGKAVVVLYFSAHWCPPCRGFTPVLKDFFKEIVSKHGDGSLAIIFVSSDRTAVDREAYFKEEHGDWLAVPYDDIETSTDLKRKCDVSGIPKLVVVNSKGQPIHENAITDVKQEQPDAAYKKWLAVSSEN